jgi:cardiolipin synthase
MFVEEYLVDLRRDRYRPKAWLKYARRCLAMAREDAFRRPATVRSIALAGLVGFLLLLTIGIALAFLHDPVLALAIFINCGFALLAGVAAMVIHVRLLVDPQGRPLARINPANLLTLSRLVIMPAMLILAVTGHLKATLAAFLVGGLTDVLDGWLARKRGDATPLGRAFDPVVDILFNASVFVVLHRVGLIPGWVLALVLTRYGLLFGGAFALYIFRGPVEIKPTVLGKSTGVVMTLLVFILVGGRIFLDRTVYDRFDQLVVAAIGFVEAITIPQVLLIGWYNFRKSGLRPAPAARILPLDRESGGSAEGHRRFR